MSVCYLFVPAVLFGAMEYILGDDAFFLAFYSQNINFDAKYLRFNVTYKY